MCQECHRDKSLLVQAGTALHRVAEGRIPRGSNKYRCEVISRAPGGAHHGPVKDVWDQPPQPAGSFDPFHREHKCSGSAARPGPPALVCTNSKLNKEQNIRRPLQHLPHRCCSLLCEHLFKLKRIVRLILSLLLQLYIPRNNSLLTKRGFLSFFFSFILL